MINRGSRIEINTGGGSIQDAILLSDNSSITKTNSDTTAQSEQLQLVAAELDALLESISKEPIDGEAPSNTEIAGKAIREIKKDSSLRARVSSSIKKGSIAALKQMLNHPAATFFIEALKEFLKEE